MCECLSLDLPKMSTNVSRSAGLTLHSIAVAGFAIVKQWNNWISINLSCIFIRVYVKYIFFSIFLAEINILMFLALLMNLLTYSHLNGLNWWLYTMWLFSWVSSFFAKTWLSVVFTQHWRKLLMVDSGNVGIKRFEIGFLLMVDIVFASVKNEIIFFFLA